MPNIIRPSYKDILWSLSEEIPNSSNLIQIANVVESLVNSVIVPSTVERTHDDLVSIARDSNTIVNCLYDGKKILAIKHLRFLTGCGLKPAKDAIEAAFPNLNARD